MCNLYRGPSSMLPTKFQFIQVSGFRRRRFFINRPIRDKNCLWWPCLFTDRDEIRNLYRGPSIDASYQVSLHLAKRFQRRIFVLIDQAETIIASGGHVCYRIRTKCALFVENLPYMLPFKVRFIWPIGFRGEDFFRNRSIREKNCLWRPYMFADRDEMSNLYRVSSIYASYQVSVPLGKQFQRRRLKCAKLTHDGRQVMVKAHIAFGRVS